MDTHYHSESSSVLNVMVALLVIAVIAALAIFAFNNLRADTNPSVIDVNVPSVTDGAGDVTTPPAQ